MIQTLNAKRENLHRLIASYNSVAIAFSGGVDSTLLAKVVYDILGDQAIALTVDSEAYPPASIIETRRLAEHIGIKLIELPATACEIEGFVRNEPDRCYHCKKALFTLMWDRARKMGSKILFDGSNVDDEGDYRPGIRALGELGVRSPLKETGFTKAEIRELSKELGLPTWNRQSYACLASRFPYGTAITPELLTRIGNAEALLHGLGFSRYRIRHHDTIARIEIAPDEMDRFLDPSIRTEVTEGIKALGYTYVTLDMEGYRTGSMNEVLHNMK